MKFLDQTDFSDIDSDFPEIHQENVIEKKLLSFLDLPEKWNFGEGMAISQAVINRAFLLVSIGHLLDYKVDVFPGNDGDVAVAFYYSDFTTEVIVERNLSLEYFKEKGKNLDYIQVDHRNDVSVNEVKLELEKTVYGEKCYTQESSTQSTSIATTNEYETSPLNILLGLIQKLQTVKEEYQYLKLCAFVTT